MYKRYFYVANYKAINMTKACYFVSICIISRMKRVNGLNVARKKLAGKGQKAKGCNRHKKTR